jgi:hypothetical protein
MEVVGSDQVHVGTVDHVEGQRIKREKADAAAGGQHHYHPAATVVEFCTAVLRGKCPVINWNGVRLHSGMLSGFKSEYLSGLRRNPQSNGR